MSCLKIIKLSPIASSAGFEGVAWGSKGALGLSPQVIAIKIYIREQRSKLRWKGEIPIAKLYIPLLFVFIGLQNRFKVSCRATNRAVRRNLATAKTPSAILVVLIAIVAVIVAAPRQISNHVIVQEQPAIYPEQGCALAETSANARLPLKPNANVQEQLET